MRGARNYPCMGHPGKRAPTVELCNDPRGYQPTGDPSALPRAVSARPQPDRAGHPARRSRRLQRADLCAGRGHAAATRVRLRRERLRMRRHPVRPSARSAARPAAWRVQAPRRRRLRPATRSTGTRYLPRRRRPKRRPATVPSPPRQVRSAATHLADRRSRSRTMTRRTGEYMTPDGQLQQLTESGCRRSDRSRGRTCSRSDRRQRSARTAAPSARAARCRGACSSARAAVGLGDVAAGEEVGDLQVALIEGGVDSPDVELLVARGEGAIGARHPVGHVAVEDPVDLDEVDRSASSPASLLTCPVAFEGTHAARADGPGLNSRLLVRSRPGWSWPILRST